MKLRTHYTMNDLERELARLGSTFLDKLVRAPWVRQAERISIARLQHVSPIEKPAPEVSERACRIVSIRFQPSQCLQTQP
jgi:hypothetical protein